MPYFEGNCVYFYINDETGIYVRGLIYLEASASGNKKQIVIIFVCDSQYEDIIKDCAYTR